MCVREWSGCEQSGAQERGGEWSRVSERTTRRGCDSPPPQFEKHTKKRIETIFSRAAGGPFRRPHSALISWDIPGMSDTTSTLGAALAMRTPKPRRETARQIAGTKAMATSQTTRPSCARQESKRKDDKKFRLVTSHKSRMLRAQLPKSLGMT